MIKNTATIIPIISLCVICVFFTAAADVLFFPEPGKTLSAETMPYTQMLHTGTEDSTFYMRGRFGVDFSVIGYKFRNNIDNVVNGNDADDGSSPKILFGINAAAHINMRPTSGMRFPVDNFYALLALNFSGVVNPALSWRFYPVHHVSAHLADGSDEIKNDIHAVSSEMARGEVYYKPFGEILEFGAGAGWYYHVCAQENLRARGDISILITPNRLFNKRLQPYALLRAENVYQGKNYFGIDMSAGVLSLNDKRGFGLSIRYFNRLHSSYYFEQYEKGWGVEYTFVY